MKIVNLIFCVTILFFSSCAYTRMESFSSKDAPQKVNSYRNVMVLVDDSNLHDSTEMEKYLVKKFSGTFSTPIRSGRDILSPLKKYNTSQTQQALKANSIDGVILVVNEGRRTSISTMLMNQTASTTTMHMGTSIDGKSTFETDYKTSNYTVPFIYTINETNFKISFLDIKKKETRWMAGTRTRSYEGMMQKSSLAGKIIKGLTSENILQ